MRPIIFFFFLLIGCTVWGQDYDDMMMVRQINCSDISNNSTSYYLRYIQDNKLDSAQNILRYWEKRCGLKEPAFRAKILLALKKGSYSDTLLPSNILEYIYIYQNRMAVIETQNYAFFDSYVTYFGYIPPGEAFDKYTLKTAYQLKTKYEPESIEYLFCEFYGGESDSIFTKLQSENYVNSSLSKEYNKELSKWVNKGEFHMALVMGVWIPTGELKPIGVHPEVGFQMGAKHRKMNYDFTLSIRFLNSPNQYYARKPKESDSLMLTDHFLGGYIGLDVGRDIFSRKGHEIQISGGIAMDGFDAFKADKDKDLEGASTWSYNFNIGMAYRFYIKNSFYIGIRTKYNIVDYTLNNVVDFTGNPVTVQFSIGGLSSIHRETELKALGYNGFRK